jgi:DNA replication protein DnaC
LDVVGGLYTTPRELCDYLIAANSNNLYDLWGRQGRVSAEAVWHEWRSTTLTVLDELGAREKVSDYCYETTKLAIDRREGKACVFISNIGLEQIEAVYDDRIASRLSAGTVVSLDGDDRRLDAK